MAENKQETIVVVGYGWVGQANALALRILGYNVFFFDPGEPAYHYRDNYSQIYDEIPRLGSVLEKDSENTWYIVAVGDRVSDEGVQDISLVEKAAASLALAKGGVIVRSTLLPKNLAKLKFDFYLPEFLHEKQAVEECTNPHYFVVGNSTQRPEPSFFAVWEERAHKTFRGTPEEASYLKYLSNVWNAVRIAFVNEYGDLLYDPLIPANIPKIERVMDFIFEKKNYLRYGRSYGGHCLPKDVLAFWGAHKDGERSVALLRAMHESNLAHKSIEEKQSALPEWFSNWAAEYKKTPMSRMREAWVRFNYLPVIRAIRSRLRVIVKTISKVIPDRDTAEVKKLWEDFAQKNPRYYVNPKTPSGTQVSDYELRETGKEDFAQHISADAALAEYLHPMSDKVAVDLGSGLGRVTEFFVPTFKEVYGVDVAPTFHELARKRVGKKMGVHFILGDGQHLPLPDESADFVFSYQTFQHLPRHSMVRSYFEEVARVLKEGGVAKIQLRTGPGAYKWTREYGVSFTSEEIKNLVESVGLKLLRMEPEKEKFLWVLVQK